MKKQKERGREDRLVPFFPYSSSKLTMLPTLSGGGGMTSPPSFDPIPTALISPPSPPVTPTFPSVSVVPRFVITGTCRKFLASVVMPHVVDVSTKEGQLVAI